MKLTRKQMEVKRRYGLNGNPGLPCPVNHIVIHGNGSYRHEMAKAIEAVRIIYEDKVPIITEAVNKETGNRVDIVSLDGEEVEVDVHHNNLQELKERGSRVIKG